MLQDVAPYCLYSLSAYKMNFKKINYTTLETPIAPLQLESGQPVERHSRPLTKLSLSNLIRPPSSRPQSPTPNAPPLVQDGSYLEMLSLKLSEAVLKALAPPIGPPSANEHMEARRIIPTGRGIALGCLIASYVTFSFSLVWYVTRRNP